jgi:uncharacterized FlaG/YvyC family protein
LSNKSKNIIVKIKENIIMIIPNIQALKVADNLKWDFQLGYQKALQIFNYSGEVTPEYQMAVKELEEQMKAIKANADFLIEKTKKKN